MWCQRRCFVEQSRRYRRPIAAVSQASKGGIATQIFGAARFIVSVAPSLSLVSFRVTILPTVSAMHSLGVWAASAGLNQHRSHCYVECVTPRLHLHMTTHVWPCGLHWFLRVCRTWLAYYVYAWLLALSFTSTFFTFCRLPGPIRLVACTGIRVSWWFLMVSAMYP